LEQRAHVARIVRDELAVLHDRFVVALLVDELLRRLKDLFAIERHSGLFRDLRLQDPPPLPTSWEVGALHLSTQGPQTTHAPSPLLSTLGGANKPTIFRSLEDSDIAGRPTAD